jgi:hypothetical protein
MEKLNRNFQREISNLSYWTECFCVDPNPPIFLSSFITAEVDIRTTLFFDKINLKIIDLQNQHKLTSNDMIKHITCLYV